MSYARDHAPNRLFLPPLLQHIITVTHEGFLYIVVRHYLLQASFLSLYHTSHDVPINLLALHYTKTNTHNNHDESKHLPIPPCGLDGFARIQCARVTGIRPQDFVLEVVFGSADDGLGVQWQEKGLQGRISPFGGSQKFGNESNILLQKVSQVIPSNQWL